MDSKQMDPELKTYYEQVKSDIKSEHFEYLAKHPEVREFLNDFLSSLLLHKPDDVYKYAQEFFKFFNQSDEPALFDPLVISGPSGVGKGTLIKYLLSKYPDTFALSTSYTTRQPRPGEEHGREYFFVSKEYFYEVISYYHDRETNPLLYHIRRYQRTLSWSIVRCTATSTLGTHKDLVRQIREQKKICILEIDVAGAQKVSKSGYKCNYLFIKAPSGEELKRRLEKRGTENEAQIERRLKGAEVENKLAMEDPLFKSQLINDDLETTKKDLIEYLNKHYPGCDFKY